MADPQLTDLVQMKHPDAPDAAPAATTRDAFESVWKAQGFEIVEDPAVEQAAANPVDPVDPAVASTELTPEQAAAARRSSPVPAQPAARPQEA